MLIEVLPNNQTTASQTQETSSKQLNWLVGRVVGWGPHSTFADRSSDTRLKGPVVKCAAKLARKPDNSLQTVSSLLQRHCANVGNLELETTSANASRPRLRKSATSTCISDRSLKKYMIAFSCAKNAGTNPKLQQACFKMPSHI